MQGHLPQNKNEIIIILDKYNRIDDITLMVLDLYSPLDEIESFSFEDLIGLEFKIIKNDDYFFIKHKFWNKNYRSDNI